MRQEIHDRSGKRIGSIEDRTGEQVAYDASGRRVGRYNKSSDTTYDTSGRKFSDGNMLACLING